MYQSVRCPNCGRKLVELDGKAVAKCHRCKSIVDIDTNREVMARVR